MERITINLVDKSRSAVLNGRQYLVSPATLIVPGVLKGSQGALYYPPEEVGKNPAVWNGIPLVVLHPVRNSQHVSANDPEVLEAQGVGNVFRSKFKDKLTAEAWFDVEATRRVDNRVLDALESGKSIELSTGLFTDNEPAANGAVTDDGKSYDFTARNYRPDHLAVLPDQIGACSVEDGCGINVNINDLSHDDLRNLLQTKLAEKLGTNTEAWVSDVFDNHFIYRLNDKLFRLGYAKNDSEVILSEEQPVEVERVTTFEPIANKEFVMNEQEKKKVVDGLIANSCCWEEADRETLNALPDDKLTQLTAQAKKDEQREAVVNAVRKGFTDSGGVGHTWNEEKQAWEGKIVDSVAFAAVVRKAEPVVNKEADEPKKPLTTEEWMKSAPSEIQGAVQNAIRIESKEKAQLIERLTINIKDDESKQRLQKRLQSKPLDELHDMMVLAPPTKETTPTANYSGVTGSGQQTQERDRSQGLRMPTINWAEEQEKQSA